MQEEQQTIHFNLAHDGGNGYMKDRLNGKTTIFPSVIADFMPGMQNITVDSASRDDVESFLDDFIDNMDITTNSKGISDNGRYLVGQAAAYSGVHVTTFNVNNTAGKNTSDISVICALAFIAYNALNIYYRHHLVLPDSLNVSVDKFATDLPIDEFKNQEIVKSFIARFKDNLHTVTINTFDKPINVQIKFGQVAVEPEGLTGERGLIISPSYRGMYRDDDVFNPLLVDYQLDHFDGQDLAEAGNVICIDIGDGTVDFSTMNGLSTLTLANMNDSLASGVGNVATDAINALHQKYPMIRKLNRQKFMEIANRGNDKESLTYKKFFDEQVKSLNRRIISKLSAIYNSLDQQVGMIVVCGGGAVALKDSLAPALKEAMSKLDVFDRTKIFWIDKEFAQTLNLDGLQARILSMRDRDDK